MKLSELSHKNVCVLGYSREGRATHTALKQYVPTARITIADTAENIQAEGATLKVGKTYLENLDQFDVIIKTAGMPLLPELVPVRHKITSATRIFFDTIAASNVCTIGVTGSKGKSTTTNLIYHALKAHSPQTYLMGNIGVPMMNFLDKAKPGTYFVIELSSYQLEDMTRSPHIAVVTSFFPEHLDRHKSVETYWEVKRAIAAFQTEEDTIFYNAAYEQCEKLASASPGKRIGFTAADFPLPLTETRLRGEHNRSNLAAALKVAEYLGVPREVALQALQSVDPLPHRLQNLGVHRKITWINDSFATAPEATLAALQALGNTVDTLLVGGVDRGYDFNELAGYLAKSSVRNIVLFPESGSIIRQKLEAGGTAKNMYDTSDMADAVHWAAEHTEPGKTCLLSSAGPSFNLFKDFVARGEAFIAAAESLD